MGRSISDRADFGVALALGLVALAWFSLTWTRTFDLLDEGHLMNQSLRVLRGDVPLRDFSEAYGPGVFGLNALVLWLSDGAILPVRVTIALFKAGIVALTYLTARALVPRPFALLGGVLGAVYWGRLAWNLNTPYGSVYTTFFCLLATYLLMRVPLDRARPLFWAGLAGGAAFLFKQSVAAYGVFGLGLALWSVDTVKSDARGSGRLPAPVVPLLWAVAGLVLVWPLRAYLSPREYALHFLPVHALMVLIGVFALRARSGMSDQALFSPRMAWLVAGGVSVPLATLALYAVLGGAGSLVHNMFVFSLVRENYVAPVSAPPAAIGAIVLGGGLLLWAALLAMGRAWSAVGATAVGALALGAWGASSLPAIPPLGELWRTSADLMLGLQGTVVLGAAVGLAWSAWSAGAARAFLPLFFFQAMTVLQVFPRAGYNVLLHAGDTVPLMVYVLWRWSRLAGARSAAERALAYVIVAVVPLWLASPIVAQVWEHASGPAPRHRLVWEETAGIELSSERHRQRRIQFLEPLIAHLRAAGPPEAPLLLLTREPMILYLSRRAPLFGAEQYPMHLVGIRMLPVEAQARLLAPEGLVETFRRRPDTIVVTADDPASVEYRRRFSELWDEVGRGHRPTHRFGPYTVWRSGGSSGRSD